MEYRIQYNESKINKNIKIRASEGEATHWDMSVWQLHWLLQNTSFLLDAQVPTPGLSWGDRDMSISRQEVHILDNSAGTHVKHTRHAQKYIYISLAHIQVKV